ncbi:hypothetical protein AN1V17_15690 [Vallitalea sediminicola]
MRKYKKYILMLITLVIIIQIINFNIPRKLQDILSISSNTVVNYCSVYIIDYKPGGGRDNSNVKLTVKQFQDIMDIMKKTKYHKTFDPDYHSSNTEGFYFMDFTYVIDNTKKVRRMTYSKDGYIEISGKSSYISFNQNEPEKLAKEVYEYINNIIAE